MTLDEKMEAAGYWTAAKTAQVAGVAVLTVYNWIQAGKIEGTRVTDRWYVTRESLIEHLGPVGAKAAGLVEGDETC